jgi:rubrerythrin
VDERIVPGSLLADRLLSETRTGAIAYVRNLVAAEEAIVRGQFNVSKILRAAAFSQRALALNAARALAEDRDPSALFEQVSDELVAGSGSGAPLPQNESEPSLSRFLMHGDVVRGRLDAILTRAVASLAENSDVLESDVDQWLIGCHRCGNVMEGLTDLCNVCGALRTELQWFGPYYSRTEEHLGQRMPEEIIAILEVAPGQVADAILGVDDRVLARRPSADEWSAKEIIGHMVETDILFRYHLDVILAAAAPPELPLSQVPWRLHEGKGYEEMSAAGLVDRFERTRAETLALVKSLTAEQWSLRGLLMFKPRTVVDLGTWLANHDPGHLVQVRRLCQEG